MSFSYVDLNRILAQSIIDANLGVTIAHENAVFDPEQLQEYAEVHTLINERESMTKDGYGEVYGVYQVDINVRAGKSVGRALELVTKVVSHYSDTLTLESGTTQLIVMNSYREPAVRGNGWYTIPVTIEFRARPTA